jgi:glutamyl-tRNA synthetase
MTETTRLRVRFAPSPTGHLHIGSARTALFNWLLARKTGGAFILRIEDTDTARNVTGAEEKIMEDLRWLGLQWDEGIGVGGPNEPYYQSQRLDLYSDAVQKLLDAGLAYHAFDTAEELEAMREKARAEKRDFIYPRPGKFPTEDDVARARAEGKPVVVRFMMPSEDITVHDEVMGNVTITSAQLGDFIIQKADGMPTYHLANVYDDGVMGVNLVIRGQEFLGQTPRHIALQQALGFHTPRYAHMPLTMDMQGRKLAKRDGAVEVFSFRQAGYLPEALINFIVLLGWSPGDDREKFIRSELIQEFSVARMTKANAKFDRDKLLSFNTDAMAEAAEDRLLEAFNDFLEVTETHIGQANLDDETKRMILRSCKGARTLMDIETKCGILFADDAVVEYDAKAIKKVMGKNDGEGYAMLDTLLPKLGAMDDWSAEPLEKMIESVCEEKQVGMGKVAQPIRVAVTGSTVSPGITDTLILLGKEKTISRIKRLLAERPTV